MHLNSIYATAWLLTIANAAIWLENGQTIQLSPGLVIEGKLEADQKSGNSWTVDDISNDYFLVVYLGYNDNLGIDSQGSSPGYELFQISATPDCENGVSMSLNFYYGQSFGEFQTLTVTLLCTVFYSQP